MKKSKSGSAQKLHQQRLSKPGSSNKTNRNARAKKQSTLSNGGSAASEEPDFDLPADKNDPDNVGVNVTFPLLTELKPLLGNRRLLFNPVSRLELQPMLAHAQDGDALVYCDWSVEFQKVSKANLPDLLPGWKLKSGTMLLPGDARQFAEQALTPPRLAKELFPTQSASPWAWSYELEREGEGPSCVIALWFVTGDPITAYQKLFADNQLAPHIISLKRPDPVTVEVWNAFTGIYGPLIGVMDQNKSGTSRIIREN